MASVIHVERRRIETWDVCGRARSMLTWEESGCYGDGWTAIMLSVRMHLYNRIEMFGCPRSLSARRAIYNVCTQRRCIKGTAVVVYVWAGVLNRKRN